jgi:NAD(P)-dependent dehydrogenase (short-subunit alcohol dehydrogenase family)
MEEGAMDLGLKNATTAVVGGTRGMGRATAECFAADGARVAVLARNPQELEETVAHLRSIGSPDAAGFRIDVTDRPTIDAAFVEIGRRFGTLNSLVNTVGPNAGGTLDELTDAGWDLAFALGTMSAVRTVRAALPLLRRAEWARIVNVSAHSTKRQSPNLIAYTAAKAACTSLTKNLAKTLAPEGILVNVVSPGTFLSGSVTDWFASVAKERGLDPTSLEDLNTLIRQDYGSPADLGRAGLVEEIGAVIAFAASRRNSYMTGANINVDGGSDFC